MKILIIRNYPSYMAVKNNTYNIQEVGLAKALVRKNNICDIVFWTAVQEETVTIPVDNGGVVRVFYRKGKTMFKNTIFAGCEKLYEQYDILQPCEYNQMQAWLLAKNQPNKTVIYHGPYFSPFNKRYNLMCRIFDVLLLRKYIKQKTKFLVKSEMAKEFLIGKGISPSNVSVVGVGIDTQMLSTNKDECKEMLFLQMKRDVGKLKILYVGRFEERRNIPFIIDIFNKVLRENNNARLYMIGTGEAEYIKLVLKHADDLGCRNFIYWQEKIEQKYLSNIYQEADFFLLPTEYEIFGMVLLEAMYYGTVVLTTKNGGSSTLIVNGENGFILTESKAGIWAKLITDLSQDHNRKKKIEKSATEAITSYTWDALADKIIVEYRKRLNF